MPLFVPGHVQHLKELNDKNRALATPSDIEFGDREDTTAEEKEKYKNKESKRLVRGVSAKYHGEVPIYYDRLNLETCFANQLVKVTFYTPISTLYDQLDVINEQFSTIFTEDDLEDVVLDPGLDEGIITLKVKGANHPYWRGQVLVAYEVLDPVKVMIPDVLLDGVMTPNDSTQIEQTPLRYSPLDFKEHRDWFKACPVGPLDLAHREYLRDILTAADGTAWVAEGPGDYSLAGVELTYVGNDINQLMNRQYPNVAIFTISANQSALTAGNLYLHYSDKENT